MRSLALVADRVLAPGWKVSQTGIISVVNKIRNDNDLTDPSSHLICIGIIVCVKLNGCNAAICDDVGLVAFCPHEVLLHWLTS